MPILFLSLFLAAVPPWDSDLQKARDAQDRPRLERITAELSATAEKQANDAQAQYQAAFTNSTRAEVATELRDKAQARAAAEAGMKYAERAVALKANMA